MVAFTLGLLIKYEYRNGRYVWFITCKFHFLHFFQ